MSAFSAPTREWFDREFDAPTDAQLGAWDSIANGNHTLVVAPTGSGKTLAAFLWALDTIATGTPPEEAVKRCRILYVSPLKALGADVERNLRAPLVGIKNAADILGREAPSIRVGVRTGDTPAKERRAFETKPPDVLITTPESLFLILTSKARAGLSGIETVILDEIHAVAGTKRGAHLALSLERLDALLERPAQRVGLSATVRPLEAMSRFLSGGRTLADGGRSTEIVAPPSSKTLEIDLVVPVPDLSDLATAQLPDSVAAADAIDFTDDTLSRRRASIWPHVEERIVETVLDAKGQPRSTIVFANSRRGAERLTARLNELWSERQSIPLPDPGSLWASEITAQSGTAVGADPVFARTHHGSMSRVERTHVEEALKSGQLPVVVATSSLELGIDMDSVDLVIQVSAPPSVAAGLQRIGRAGHRVGAASHGVIFPTHRGDLLQAAVVAQRMKSGSIEEIASLRNPLDVLAQHIVAMVAMDDWPVSELSQVVRRAEPFTDLGDNALDSVLDMLSGRYPSEDFVELRPRVVWDRVADSLSSRPGASRLAVTSGGTIPDRGLFGVFLAGAENTKQGSTRVGELDEEMVYESRVGDVFTLGTSSWRISDITPDRVLVTPAPGAPGRLPFWRGDAVGRPVELGTAIGRFVRSLSTEPSGIDSQSNRQLLQRSGLDQWAQDNLLGYLTAQRAATGHLPDDRTIVVERFRDELGDWRIVVHTPFGSRVHAPWAIALAGRAQQQLGVNVQAMHADDGIVLRVPDTTDAMSGSESVAADIDLTFDHDEVRDLVTEHLGSSALYAARFREAAARSLLLPRRRPDRRQPLWVQRQRSAQLLQVAAGFDSFPVTHEAVRECLQDVFDVPALEALMGALARREVTIVDVTTPSPSPFAQSLLFGYVAQYLYEGDSPLAERRAAALTLDPSLLAELLGAGGASDLADLLDARVVVETEDDLQLLSEPRQAHDAEHLVDMFRRLGPLTRDDIAQRTNPDVRDQLDLWTEHLCAAGRVIPIRLAGAPAFAAVEDAARVRDGLGAVVPGGLPSAFTKPAEHPLLDLIRRYARTHGPFRVHNVAAHFGLAPGAAARILTELEEAGSLISGRIRPPEAERENEQVDLDYCETSVVKILKRRSLAALRSEVEPVTQARLAQFLPSWQAVGSSLHGLDGVARVIEQLAGASVPLSAWESLVLPSRVSDYRPEMLDELTTSGEVLWVGAGRIGSHDGWISLHPYDTADLTIPAPLALTTSPLHDDLLTALGGGGGFFFPELMAAVEALQLEREEPVNTRHDMLTALWDLVWIGEITNDTLAPLRAQVGRRSSHSSTPRTPRAAYGYRRASLRGLRAHVAPAAAHADAVRGRWTRISRGELDPTVRSHAEATVLLDRYGIFTRGIAVSENVPGGFATVYRVLSHMEESGQARRGYFVEGLGAAQFAQPGVVDRLRAIEPMDATPLLLAATDPASAYGAALPWPSSVHGSGSHRPGRRAGAMVVLDQGSLIAYIERGATSMLTFSEDEKSIERVARHLAALIDQGRLQTLAFNTIDGQPTLGDTSVMSQALSNAGFTLTPKGLRKVSQHA